MTGLSDANQDRYLGAGGAASTITVYGPRHAKNAGDEEGGGKVKATVDTSDAQRLVVTFHNLDLKGKGNDEGNDKAKAKDKAKDKARSKAKRKAKAKAKREAREGEKSTEEEKQYDDEACEMDIDG